MPMKARVEGWPEIIRAVDTTDDEWRGIQTDHARAMRRGLWIARCPGCDWPMTPKISQLGNRFFAHRPDAPETCYLRQLEGESAQHFALKTEIYKAAKRLRSWTADVEVPAPESDPLTGKPIVVDVVAQRTRAAATVRERAMPTLVGWEVQTSPIDEGAVLTRQELRDRWLGRCTWVTTRRPRWADRLPWYQVHSTPLAITVVVDGVVRWDQPLGDFVNEQPFPNQDMVRFIQRGAMWVQDVGWRLDLLPGTTDTRRRQHRQQLPVAAHAVQEYCDRIAALPEYTQRWTDLEWQRYATVARDRLAHGEALSPLDTEALARFPDDELAGDLESVCLDFDPMRDTAPCVECGRLAIPSASAAMPICHHCAWHLRRGDDCEWD